MASSVELAYAPCKETIFLKRNEKEEENDMKKWIAGLFVVVAVTLPAEEWQRVEDFDFNAEEGYTWLILEEGSASLMLFSYIDGRSRSGTSTLSIVVERDLAPRGEVVLRAWDDGEEPTSLVLSDMGVAGMRHDRNVVEFYGRLFEVLLMTLSRSENIAFELTVAGGDRREWRFGLPENTRTEIAWMGRASQRYIVEEQRRLRRE